MLPPCIALIDLWCALVFIFVVKSRNMHSIYYTVLVLGMKLVPVNGSSVPSSSRCWWRIMLCHWLLNAVLKQEQFSGFSVFACWSCTLCACASRGWLLSSVLSSPLGVGNGWSFLVMLKKWICLLSCDFILTVGWVRAKLIDFPKEICKFNSEWKGFINSWCPTLTANRIMVPSIVCRTAGHEFRFD